jgi:carbonic anhydrase/acetyltransferase-like protein (isoleucine patch superfamily)
MGAKPSAARKLTAGFTPALRAGTLFSSEASMIRSYQGKRPQFPASCYIDDSAQLLGDVVLGERSSVWMNAVLRGDVNSIRIGACSNVQDCSVLHGQRQLYPVIVGDWVTIGHNATVHGCVVEDMVVIGMGARVLNDSHVGEGSIIAAGSVVAEHTRVPPRTLWAGVPAKLRREISDKDLALIREYAQNYLDYVEIYLNEVVAESGAHLAHR